MSPGKISHLPRPLRDELNLRLERSVSGRELVAWLNSLPEVQSMLAERFNGDPVNEQNISNWRRSGFVEWQHRQAFFEGLQEIAADAADIEASVGSLTDHVARLLALHFSQLLCPPATVRGQSSPRPPDCPIELLLQLTRAVASLRRDDLAAARLKLQQEIAAARARTRTSVAEKPRTHAPVPMPAQPQEANTLAAAPLAFAPPPSPAGPAIHSPSPVNIIPPPEIKPSQGKSSLESAPVPSVPLNNLTNPGFSRDSVCRGASGSGGLWPPYRNKRAAHVRQPTGADK